MTQLELHKKIEDFFQAGIESADIKTAKDFFINDDAKKYFFFLANDSWLDWLWRDGSGLLGTINNVNDSARLNLPELEYLRRMTDQKPEKVASIINSIKISENNFNPEILDRCLWIISILPAEQIKTLMDKILEEKWFYLLRNFSNWGHAYELKEMIKELVAKNENETILKLAQAIFIVKTKSETSKGKIGSFIEEPFYIKELSTSGIFGALANIKDAFAEKALEILAEAIAQIIKLSDIDDTKIFDYADPFSLFDIDFFTVELEEERSYSDREDIKNLATTIKKLLERTINQACQNENEDDAQRLLKYINDIPSCRSMWRLKLFALAQCPKIFKKELKGAFLEIFNVGERYFEIEGGAEYHQTLMRGFSVLDSKTEQRDYVQEIFKYFDNPELKDPDKRAWRKRDGAKLLCFIKDHLTPGEKKIAKERFNISLDESRCVPEPVVGKVQAGFVHPRSPIDLNEFTIEQIIKNLQSDWTPDKFKEQFKNDNFLTPRGAEGLGNALQEDIKQRTDEYLKYINSFFEKDKIHPSYLYSLLRGIEEMLRNKQSLSLIQIGQLLGLFELIQKNGEKEPFKKSDKKTWLVDWIGVHRIIADTLLYILEDKSNREVTHATYKAKIKDLISYLLTIQDSPSKEDEKPEYGDPYHIAINSVRGRAYEAFVVFVENDGKILADYTQEIFKQALNDDSLAVRFVIGRYLATFFFRSQKFIIDLLPEIFPKDNPNKKDIYLATWEGYLSNTLYEQLFTVLHDQYSHAITLDSEYYTQRKYIKGLDESLAVHLALAFLHLGMEESNDLFVQFWDKSNSKRHKEFVSFIGRSCLTRDRAGDEWLKENKVNKDKLVEFWEWILSNKYITDPEIFSGFGFWINPEKEILDDNIVIEKMAETLKKSDGSIDWEYGLLRRLTIFAEKQGAKTLEIIWSYLLNSQNNLNQNRRVPFMYEDEIEKSLKIIYTNGDLSSKQKVVDLINILIEKGSNMFWKLKEILKS